MGLENCDKNIWAVALRDIIYKKSSNEILLMSEDQRNLEIAFSTE